MSDESLLPEVAVDRTADPIDRVDDSDEVGRRSLASRACSPIVDCICPRETSFYDFLYQRNVVDLALGIILGRQLNDLANAIVTDLLTPFIGALYTGSDFEDASFSWNGSVFDVGHLAAVFLTVLFVFFFVYRFLVIPLARVNLLKISTKRPTKECFLCFSTIDARASRCAHCAGRL